MIEDDVQDDRNVPSVALGHEILKTRRAAVGLLHGEGEDSVVAPIAPAGELRHRHDLHSRHAEIDQVVECAHRPREGALIGECPDVQLIEDPLPQWSRAEFCVAPRVGQIDHLRGTVHTIGLCARGRVGQCGALVEDVLVQRAGAPGCGASVIPVGAAAEADQSAASVHRHRPRVGCPHGERRRGRTAGHGAQVGPHWGCR